MKNIITKYKYSRAALILWTALIFIIGYVFAIAGRIAA